MLLHSPIKNSISWDEIRYSQVWEDSRRLRRSLEILPTDHVLSIGSAGCNALELLLDNPRQISVIDLSPAQHALLNLKFTAISVLNFAMYNSLLGIELNYNPLSIYQSLRSQLLPTTCHYFDNNLDLLSHGLIHQGRLEKYFRLFREKGLRQIWNSEFVAELLDCQCLEEQRSLLRTQGRLEALAALANQFFDRSGLEKARDPGQMLFVTESQMGQVLFERFMKVIQEQSIATNPYLIYFLTGQMPPEKIRLPSLRQENYSLLQDRIHRIELHHIDLESFLSTMPDEGLQKLNLSDIFEYLSPTHCQNVFDLMSRKLSSGGRLAYWSFFVDRSPQIPALQKIENSDPDQVWFYKDFAAYQKI